MSEEWKDVLDGIIAKSRDSAKEKKIEPAATDDPQVFVLADLVNAPFKSDTESLDFPLFSVSRGKDDHQDTFQWESPDGRFSLTVEPRYSRYGRPTILDKGLVIYVMSQIIKHMDQSGGDVPKTVWLNKNRYLESTGKQHGGKLNYDAIDTSLDRLVGTRIKLIRDDKDRNERTISSVSYFESYEVIKHLDSGRTKTVQIRVSDYLRDIIRSRKFLTISSDYFSLSGMERRIYEICRKQAGKKTEGSRISLEKIHAKTGSTMSLPEFRKYLMKIQKAGNIPEYQIEVAKEWITITPISPEALAASVAKAKKAPVTRRTTRKKAPREPVIEVPPKKD